MTDVQNRLIIDNLSLADKIARSKSKNLYTISSDELHSAAYYGLVDAAIKYNPAKCDNFSGYATIRIFGAIRDYLREMGRHKTAESGERVFTDESKNEFFDLISKSLTNREKTIIRLYYWQGFTLKEIGEKLLLKEARVSQILKHIKKSLEKTWRFREQQLLVEIL